MGEVEAVAAMMKTWVHERTLDDSPGAARGPVTVDDEAMFLARFASGALGRLGRPVSHMDEKTSSALRSTASEDRSSSTTRI